MRRIVKLPNSEVVEQNLKYSSTNTANNKKIAAILLAEQKHICAYTEEYISRTDAADVEHFNPSLKNTPDDSYTNWFLVKHQWNKEKSNRWNEFLPILYPVADDFEERVIYDKGYYITSSDTDIEAVNLIKLLQLNEPALAEKRKKYIARKRLEMEVFGESVESFFATLIEADTCQINYPRAIKEHFGIDIWSMLP